MHYTNLMQLIQSLDEVLEKNSDLIQSEGPLHAIIHKLFEIAVTILIDYVNV